jgi:hypothetical protein
MKQFEKSRYNSVGFVSKFDKKVQRGDFFLFSGITPPWCSKILVFSYWEKGMSTIEACKQFISKVDA